MAEGAVAAPRSDWKQQRLGPMPPEAMVKLAESAFARSLAAAGCSPSLFNDADGTSKREALRQWHMGVVRPLARMLSAELSEKFGTPTFCLTSTTIRNGHGGAGASICKVVSGRRRYRPEMALALAQIGDGDDY